GDEPFAACTADLHPETRDTAHSALFVMREDPFYQWMPRCEEVDGLFLDSLLAIERARVARAAGDTRKTIDQRSAADLDGGDMMAARALDGEPEPRTGSHHDLFVERIEIRGHAGEDPCGHVRKIRVAMQLLIRSFADACARGLGFGDEFVELR